MGKWWGWSSFPYRSCIKANPKLPPRKRERWETRGALEETWRESARTVQKERKEGGKNLGVLEDGGKSRDGRDEREGAREREERRGQRDDLGQVSPWTPGSHTTLCLKPRPGEVMVNCAGKMLRRRMKYCPSEECK
ncbi:hypothetical protein E2C01_050374 [Portunus trituberculatus]|uniref:Uncharacterized protein n=1 Tax=Portunus trituberculatus TaxID=210409 RepID=A0A5B7GIR8_PORTR|nr:hypothetical protein [Portunus trituberculatus]